MAEAYEPTERSKVNRYKTRANYDYDTIHGIIDTCPVLHVSFNPSSMDDDPFPTILPMIGCTGSYTPPNAAETSAVCVYLHGHSSSRFMKLPAVQSESDDPVYSSLPGTPACIAATHMDGVVLALTPFNHSCNYRSAVIHGYANIVTDSAEKMYALQLITDSLIPSRWDHSRVPPTPSEMNSTSVLRVDIVSASAKIRAGPPGNDRADLDDVGMRQRVWTGVLPAWGVWGPPVAAPENLVPDVPGYISDFVKEQNDKGERYATEIAGKALTSKKQA
ncbi:hypothetical protein JR316_0011947 [Psilocybe cubensis]|uniref:Flavin-nucleotide-binding protein n=2 Tax=Psilocybe cubensis TaxID=181762 RepID=A0A8H7XMZ9_PSICU|nr:hypothetical protein JR316_0011947 [Psilocybe cubensis]KAH9476372.1 hypothetical protein JR316_0011947 [Psilocybe cubensis]